MTDIIFPAQVVKVQTLADNGIRVTLDLPETEVFAAAQLMECKRTLATGIVTFKPESIQRNDPTGNTTTTLDDEGLALLSVWGVQP